MPRIIVTTDPAPLSPGASIWLDEHVHSVHLSTDHAAAQFVERLAWAISDAEERGRDDADRRTKRSRQPPRNRSVRRPLSQQRVRA
ncbi:MAG: hypothetical protein QOI03_1257 [Solirubrobacteraceae bacterium]|jgi:hypothetical protein|nr:hypothetical protein [Solirubrobacteraceae bacterium]